MNDKVRAILGIASKTAEVAFPQFAGAIEIGTHIATADHPVDTLKSADTQLAAAEAAFVTVENAKGVDVGNEVMFRVGVAQVLQGFQTIETALKDHTDATPSAPAV